MSPRTMVPLLASFAVLALGACGGDDSDTTPSEKANQATTNAGGASGRNAPAPSGEAQRSVKVEISDFKFTPATVTVQAGGKVTWLNQGPTDHTATLDDGRFDSGTLAEGKLKSESFKDAGTFTYHCSIHPQMKGTVEVVESD